MYEFRQNFPFISKIKHASYNTFIKPMWAHYIKIIQRLKNLNNKFASLHK